MGRSNNTDHTTEMRKLRKVNCYRCERPISREEGLEKVKLDFGDSVLICRICKVKIKKKRSKLIKRKFD